MTKPTNQAERLKKASRRRREQQKAETRQAIVDAASDLFLKHGYEGFSLRQVAEQIGYSPGTIYLYFSNKDDLLFTLADEGYRRFAAALQSAVDSTDHPGQQIMAMGRAYIDFGLANPIHYRLMFMERPEFLMKAHEGHDLSIWQESYLILTRSVQGAIEAGHMHPGDVQTTADTLWASLHGMVALAIRMPTFDDARVKDTVERGFEVLQRGLLIEA